MHLFNLIFPTACIPSKNRRVFGDSFFIASIKGTGSFIVPNSLFTCERQRSLIFFSFNKGRHDKSSRPCRLNSNKENGSLPKFLKERRVSVMLGCSKPRYAVFLSGKQRPFMNRLFDSVPQLVKTRL